MDYRVLVWYLYICYVVLNFVNSAGQEGFLFDYQNSKDLFKDSSKDTRTTVSLLLALNIFGKLSSACTQQTLTCSTVETLENGVKYERVNNNYTRTMSALHWCLYF